MATGDVTVPWEAVATVVSGLVAAVVWLAFQLRASNERTNTQTLAMVEKVTTVITAGNISNERVADLLDRVGRLIEGMERQRP